MFEAFENENIIRFIKSGEEPIFDFVFCCVESLIKVSLSHPGTTTGAFNIGIQVKNDFCDLLSSNGSLIIPK